MKKVFIRIADSVSKTDAEKHMQSMGYYWDYFSSYTEFPEHIINSLLGFAGHENGALSWFKEDTQWNPKEYQEVFLPTNKHKHYSLIMQWAGDPTQQVWWKTSTGWIKIDKPTWDKDSDYHIGDESPKRKITIGSIEIDAPVITPPKEYYVPMITEEQLYAKYIWNGDNYDLCWLKRGLVHTTSEAAVAHAKALINISTS